MTAPHLPQPAAQLEPLTTMMRPPSLQAAGKRLRPILPKPTPQSLNSPSMPVLPGPPPEQSSISKRSLSQKIRREREARENLKPVESSASRSRRCIGQRARRQRELADKIEARLNSKAAINTEHECRSQAQKFRRQIEAAERRLQANPNCDPTESLDILLEYDVDNISRCRNESHWSRMRRRYSCANGVYYI
ncbi:hypothetical protein R3P38DRAFT_3026847 [Favolaschia claudopus]|uniref:Uncharacterized protein n=1 Tax=Favolaschia claudopus TaxID=2862362 RepID=A0AAW0AFZ3_9AGAR